MYASCLNFANARSFIVFVPYISNGTIVAILKTMVEMLAAVLFIVPGAIAELSGTTRDFSFEIPPKKRMVLILKVESICVGGTNQFVVDDHEDQKKFVPGIKRLRYAVGFTSTCGDPAPGVLTKEIPVDGDEIRTTHLVVSASKGVQVFKKE